MLRIAICGGGIGGLTLALVIQKYSKKKIHVDLYEAKDKFAEIGRGPHRFCLNFEGLETQILVKQSRLNKTSKDTNCR